MYYWVDLSEDPITPRIGILIFILAFTILALLSEGYTVWDGSHQVHCTSNIFVAFVTSNSVGLADINGWVGHHGKYGC
jgi:hypothetical protein